MNENIDVVERWIKKLQDRRAPRWDGNTERRTYANYIYI